MAGFQPRKIFKPADKQVDTKKDNKEKLLLSVFVKLSVEMFNKGATEDEIIKFAETPSNDTLIKLSSFSPVMKSVITEISKHTTSQKRIKALEELE